MLLRWRLSPCCLAFTSCSFFYNSRLSLFLSSLGKTPDTAAIRSSLRISLGLSCDGHWLRLQSGWYVLHHRKEITLLHAENRAARLSGHANDLSDFCTVNLIAALWFQMWISLHLVVEKVTKCLSAPKHAVRLKQILKFRAGLLRLLIYHLIAVIWFNHSYLR